jgi:DNA-binding MarR family transcriptional regulator
MTVPLIGERYRGVEGHTGYLLWQASHTLRTALDATLRRHNLNAPQYAVLSVLARDPGSSGADLARACNTTPQATNGVLVTLEREGLIERHPHPTHGRILQVTLTEEGQRRLEAANPAVREISATIEAGLGPDEIAAIKAWLVESAARLERRAKESPSPATERLRATTHAPP